MANKIDLSTVKLVRKTNPAVAKNLLKKIKRKNKNKGEPVKTNAQVLKEALKEHFKDFENHLKDSQGVEIEYVAPEGDFGAFNEVFEKFDQLENHALDIEPQKVVEETVEEAFDDSDSEEDEAHKTMSAKKLFKLMNRPTLAQLKQAADKPEVVEIWDTTASDPKFLVYLKGLRNTIPVPAHWSEKTRYMQGRRGIEKPAYKLPPYIEATKISEIRSALQIKESEKTLKQKQRDKIRPKAHRMDIDYQTLHDAFFKYATKPSMTKFGDIYFEGKEMVLRMRRYKPGQLSEKLKHALGVGENAPPPWLINMQRFGPPPSYPNLRIPGVNAPLPESASFGYHAGGWGQLPVDSHGNPLFGYIDAAYYADNHINKEYWGEVPKMFEESESEPSSEDDEEEKKPDGTQSVIAPVADTPIPIGMKTPMIEGLDTPLDIKTPAAPRKPYTVLQPKVATNVPGTLFGSQITYQMPPPVAVPLGAGGTATPFGGIATPSLTTDGEFIPLQTIFIDVDGTATTDDIMRQLKYHESKAKKAHEAAGIEVSGDASVPKPKKKKKEFKF